MAMLARDGVNIYYETHGEGPVILLSHGFASTSRMWRGQIESLSRKHKLVLWDMRGHGQSDYPPDQAAYSEEATIGDMLALLDAVGAKKAIVGGHSLGGYMSLAFHASYPERVSALMIVDTGPGFRKDEAREGWNQNARRRAERFEAQGLGTSQSASPEVAAAQHRDATGLARAARGMLTQKNARVIESLPHIKVPSIVIVGANDTPFLAAADYMCAKIPGAQKVVIADAGHAPNIDQPASFNAALEAFLAKLN